MGVAFAVDVRRGGSWRTVLRGLSSREDAFGRAVARYGLGSFRVREVPAHGPRVRCALADLGAW